MATIALFHRKQTLTKKQMAGIASGAAVAGAATAMFLTPKTGKQMRGHAVSSARRAKHKAGRMAHNMHKSDGSTKMMSGMDSQEWSGSNQDNGDGSPLSTAS